MTAKDIDIPLLIASVKKQTCIWNYKLPEYSDKKMKNRAWVSICEELSSDFEDKSPSEKMAYVIQIQSKWKILRDGYTRYRRNLKKNSSYITKEYTYYKDLLFLKDVVGDKDDNGSNVDMLPPKIERNDRITRKRKHDNNDQPNVYRAENKTPKTEKNDRTMHRKRKSDNDEQLTNENRDNRTCSCEDEDKLFLLSLLSDFRKISEHYKLDAKGEIIQIIRNYRDVSTYNFMDFAAGPSSSDPLDQTSYDNQSQDSLTEPIVTITEKHEESEDK